MKLVPSILQSITTEKSLSTSDQEPALLLLFRTTLLSETVSDELHQLHQVQWCMVCTRWLINVQENSYSQYGAFLFL